MSYQYWIQQQAPDGGFFDVIGMSENGTLEAAQVQFESWKEEFPARSVRLVLKTCVVIGGDK